MKILVICGSFPPVKCGVGDYAYTLYNKMADKADITVLTSKKACSDNTTNIKVLNIIDKWRGLSLIRTVLRIIKKEKIDLVHFQFPTVEYGKFSFALFIMLPIILRLKRIRVVYTFHEYSNNRWVSKLLRKPAIYMSNKIIVVDDGFKPDIYARNRLINKRKIDVVHIGSNIPKSTLSDERLMELRKTILDNTSNHITNIIAYFGFINVAKRMDILFNALAQLKKEGKLSTMLLIIGEFNSEKCPVELFEELQNIIEKNQLREYIHVTGYIDATHVGDYLKLSDAAVLLFKNGVSVRNGSMLAAQQEGLRIITTKPSANIDYFENDQFRLVENDVEQVMQEILDLQSHPVDKYNFNNVADWDDIVARHLEIYSDVLKGKNR